MKVKASSLPATRNAQGNPPDGTLMTKSAGNDKYVDKYFLSCLLNYTLTVSW